MTTKIINLICALKANNLKVCTINYSINVQQEWGSTTPVIPTVYISKNVTALYIWTDT